MTEPINHKNNLSEYLQAVGYPPEVIEYETPLFVVDEDYRTEVTISLDKGRQVTATGTASKRKAAEMEAAKIALQKLRDQFPDLNIDWNQTFVEAQVGDALIKLVAYFSEQLPTAQAASEWLQVAETDATLAQLYDRLREQGHPSFTVLGDHLKEKKKATWTEAYICRQFGASFRTPEAKAAAQKLYEFLEG